MTYTEVITIMPMNIMQCNLCKRAGIPGYQVNFFFAIFACRDCLDELQARLVELRLTEAGS